MAPLISIITVTFNAGATIPATIKSDNDAPGIVYGQTELVDSDRNLLGPRHLNAPEVLTYESFKDGMLVCHQAFVVLAKIAPLYDLKYKLSADYDWCIQCLQHSRKNVYIPGVMIDYLSEGASTQQRRRSLKERFKIMCYYYGTLPTIMRHISFVPRYLANRRRMKSAQAAINKE